MVSTLAISKGILEMNPAHNHAPVESRTNDYQRDNVDSHSPQLLELRVSLLEIIVVIKFQRVLRLGGVARLIRAESTASSASSTSHVPTIHPTTAVTSATLRMTALPLHLAVLFHHILLPVIVHARIVFSTVTESTRGN